MLVSSVVKSCSHTPRSVSTLWKRSVRRSDTHSSPVDATHVSDSEKVSSSPVRSMRPKESCRIAPTLSIGV
jgi:hypothetical protein